MKRVIRILRFPLGLMALATLVACGGGGGGGGPPPPPPPDTTAPTVSAVSAGGGSTLNRVVTLSVTASDNVGVADVRFFADGALLGNDNTAPYSFDWDTGAEAEGDHVLHAEAMDAAGNVGRSTDVTVTVKNVVQFAVTATGFQEVTPTGSTGSATADLTFNLASGEVSGSLVVSGVDATAAHIHDAFAGSNGNVLVPFTQDATDASLFALASGLSIGATGIDRLLSGALYVNVHSGAFPGGEVRGQILPEGFVLHFSDLTARQSVPRKSSLASGRAAITLDSGTGDVVVQARVTGLDDATQAHVHEAYAGDNGPVVIGLAKHPTDASRWFNEDATLTATALDALAAGRLYVNVHSPSYPGGEIRGQIVPDGILLLETELSGAQEVPAVDTRAEGLAFVTLDQAASLLAIHVNTTLLDDASGAHIHGAYGGDSGSVAIGLTQDGGNPSHWFAEMQTLSAAQLDAFMAGAMYVNVHSPDHLSGEIRGQLIPDGILFATGRLEGGQEIPAVSTSGGGTFAVTVDPATGALVANANTTGIPDASAAHLHDAFAGTAGGVAVPLVQDTVNAARWSAEATLTSAQLDAFAAGRFYVNVHTPTNLSGLVRGQVAPPPIEVLFTEMTGAQEVPAVSSSALSTAATTVNRATGDLTIHVRVTGADNATGSHIHAAFAGQTGGVLVPLQKDPNDAGHWSATGTAFDEDGLTAYLEGRTYVNLHTPANLSGELRGQLVPRDIRVLLSGMDGGQVVPAVVTAASGTIATTVDLTRRSLAAFINASGVDNATSAGVHVAAAGQNGPEILPLQSAATGQWSAITEPLSLEDFSAYRAGRLYAQIATPAQPDGEIRGQVVPSDAAFFDDQAPTVSITSPAAGGQVSGTVALAADASDNQGVVVVRFLFNGVLIASDTDAPYSIDWDTTTVADGAVTLTAEAEDSAGNVGVSAGVSVTVQNGTAVTLTQIQTTVFTPRCSGCHSGPTSNVLPGGMNLSTAQSSFNALVGVPSIQVPSIDRVEPNNPANSYLIQKLGGTAAVGTRMPQGGPFLDQETMDMIRAWINDGAPNN